MAAPQTKEHGEDKHTGMQEIIRKRRRKKSMAAPQTKNTEKMNIPGCRK